MAANITKDMTKIYSVKYSIKDTNKVDIFYIAANSKEQLFALLKKTVADNPDVEKVLSVKSISFKGSLVIDSKDFMPF